MKGRTLLPQRKQGPRKLCWGQSGSTVKLQEASLVWWAGRSSLVLLSSLWINNLNNSEDSKGKGLSLPACHLASEWLGLGRWKPSKKGLGLWTCQRSRRGPTFSQGLKWHLKNLWHQSFQGFLKPHFPPYKRHAASLIRDKNVLLSYKISDEPPTCLHTKVKYFLKRWFLSKFSCIKFLEQKADLRDLTQGVFQ